MPKKELGTIFHSLPQVLEFCDTAMWIEGGMLKEYGDIKKVCNDYAEYIDYYNSLSANEKQNERTAKFEKRIIDNPKKSFLSKIFRNI